MATVITDGLPQVLDPRHPNHDRDVLAAFAAGQKVYLVATDQVKGNPYWQVATEGSGSSPQLGWVAEVGGSGPAIEPFQPACPTAFPLTATEMAAISSMEGLACFGNTELTLSGTVKCSLAQGDLGIGGAAFLDGNRSCDLDETLSLYGGAITSLLDAPGAGNPTIGRYLVRGHFDDPLAQVCHSIPLGTSPSVDGGLPEPGPVAACRAMFVVSNVTRLD